MKYEKYYLQDVKDESSKKLFNVISCFAGGGGSSTGVSSSNGSMLQYNFYTKFILTGDSPV